MSISKDNAFAIIPEWLLFSGVSSNALRLYAVLWTRADYGTHETGKHSPAIRTLARDCNLSPRTVQRAMTELEEIGALVVTRRKAAEGDNLPNDYLLISADPGERRKTATGGDTGDTPGGDAGDTPGGDTGDALSRPFSIETHLYRDPCFTQRPADRSDDEGNGEKQSTDTAGAAADPISPDFHRSDDRTRLVAAVRAVAEHPEGTDKRWLAEERLETISEQVFGENLFGFAANELDPGLLPRSINRRHRDAWAAGVWLNKYLHRWKRDVGPLVWLGAGPAADRRAEIDACDLCDGDGRRRGMPCTHDPEQDTRNGSRIADIRRTLRERATA